MRYSIKGATVQQVKDAGGINLKEAHSIGIIFAELNEAQVAKLRAMGCTVTKVGGVKATVMPPAPVAGAPVYTPEQLAMAAGYEDLRGLSDPPLYGSGFALAILDTGIRETHEKIDGRVVYRKNYTTSPMRDGFDHGTGVCSIALAVAPLCNVLNMKVLDDKGEGTEEEVILAIDDCISLHNTQPDIAPWVINLSLGSPDVGNPNGSMRVACRAAIEKGIWVIAAAGNDGPSPQTVLSPACEKYVAAVGSCKYEPFVISGWSSRGPTVEGLIKPDLVLFGEDIVMASSASDTATVAKSGTSFAVPFASGMAITYHEGMYRQAVPTQVIAGLDLSITWLVSVEDMIDVYLQRVSIKPEGTVTAKDNDYGCGLPFGPLVAQALGIRPAVDFSAMMTGIIMVTMMGMIVGIMK